jgi:hypothetical protein
LDQAPGFQQKRKLLHGKAIPAEAVNAAGDRLMAAESYEDALDLYEKAGSFERVRRICTTAFEIGDVGLWMKCRRILKEPTSPEDWRKIAEKALTAEKPRFALFAFQRAGDETKVEELRQTLFGKRPVGNPSRTE